MCLIYAHSTNTLEFLNISCAYKILTIISLAFIFLVCKNIGKSVERVDHVLILLVGMFFKIRRDLD